MIVRHALLIMFLSAHDAALILFFHAIYNNILRGIACPRSTYEENPARDCLSFSIRKNAYRRSRAQTKTCTLDAHHAVVSN